MREYFSAIEYSCRCGCGLGKEEAPEEFQTMVNLLRIKCGFAIAMTCAGRCKKHNKEIGGAAMSQHLPSTPGYAADFQVRSKHQFRVMNHQALKLGFTGFGLDLKRLMIHLDTRPLPADGVPFVWGY